MPRPHSIKSSPRLSPPEATLRSRTPAHAAALEKLETILTARVREPGWPHWTQAAVAAKAALADGDVPRAQRLINQALQYSPNDRDLLYVSRVIERRLR